MFITFTFVLCSVSSTNVIPKIRILNALPIIWSIVDGPFTPKCKEINEMKLQIDQRDQVIYRQL